MTELTEQVVDEIHNALGVCLTPNPDVSDTQRVEILRWVAAEVNALATRLTEQTFAA